MSQTTTTPTTGATTPSTGEEARRKTGELAETGKQEAGRLAHQTRSEAARLAGEAGDRARERADDQVGRFATMLDGVARELDGMAEGAAGRDAVGNHHLTGLVRDGADAARRMSERLQEGGLDGVLSDVKRFARRRPGAFLASAFGVGLLLGRVTRNTDTRSIAERVRHDDESTDGHRSGDGAGTMTAGSRGGAPLASSASTTGSASSVPAAGSTRTSGPEDHT